MHIFSLTSYFSASPNAIISLVFCDSTTVTTIMMTIIKNSSWSVIRPDEALGLPAPAAYLITFYYIKSYYLKCKKFLGWFHKKIWVIVLPGRANIPAGRRPSATCSGSYKHQAAREHPALVEAIRLQPMLWQSSRNAFPAWVWMPASMPCTTMV